MPHKTPSGSLGRTLETAREVHRERPECHEGCIATSEHQQDEFDIQISRAKPNHTLARPVRIQWRSKGLPLPRPPSPTLQIFEPPVQRSASMWIAEYNLAVNLTRLHKG